MVFQDPMTSLNPYLTIGAQMALVLKMHRDLTRRRGPGRVRQAAGRRAHHRSGVPAAHVPPRTVRRHAPAGDDRHRAALPAGAADRRRADHRAGRDGAGPDPGPDGGAAREVRHRHPADHPRSGRGGGHLRPAAGDEERRVPGAGADRRLLPQPEDRLCAGIAGGGAAAGRRAVPVLRSGDSEPVLTARQTWPCITRWSSRACSRSPAPCAPWTACPWTSVPARRWASSASPAPASPRWPGRCCGW